MALSVVFLVLLVGALGVVFRGPLSDLAEAFARRFGAPGVFLGMLFIDAYAAPPLAHEPVLFFAHAGGMGFADATLVAGTGSFLAGPLGYAIGALIGRLGWVRGQLERFEVAPLMRRRGAWVVAVAAVSPIPFSASTYLAGALRVPFLPFLAACGLRYLKVALYLGLIALGWQIG
jgi:membrane protein YqaA with SNARE-associated domain